MLRPRPFALVLLLGAGALGAHAAAPSDLRVVDAYARATPPGARTAAAYLTIDNRGAVADQLVGARSPAAAAVELHAMSHEGGMMRMREIARIDLPAHGRVELVPGGVHLMIVDPKAPLRPAQRFPLTLTFARAGSIDLELEVKPLAGP
jgi:periplasmic copper chaperone A